VLYRAATGTQAAASAKLLLSPSTESWSEQYICSSDIIRHCKDVSMPAAE